MWFINVMARKLFLLHIAFLCSFLIAHASFEFNDPCKNAYREILNVRLDLAKTYLAKEQATNPENLIPILLANYIEYFQLLTSDDKTLFDELKQHKAERLSIISAGDKNSPYYLFALAEINLQWALLRGRYQEYVNSALEIKKAVGLLEENAEKFPDFLPNKIGLGMLNAVLGSLPAGAQKALGVLGIKGNTRVGEQLLKTVVNQLPNSEYRFFYDEAVFYLMEVKVNITKDKNTFFEIIEKTKLMNEYSLLKTYISAYTAYKTGHNDEAIRYLINKPKGNSYTPYPYLTYLLGMAQVNKLDKSASNTLKKFLEINRGVSYVKDSYLHLAYISYIDGNLKDYRSFLARVKQEGNTYDERDKQALSEAGDADPNIVLLKARFLFDGGYYDEVKKLLFAENVNHYTIKRDKIEYCYRLARVFDVTGGLMGAEKFYKYTIAFGKNDKYYYAANAALLLGNMYENKKQYQLATHYYQQAIDMKNHDYEGSIENKAKEGLNRLAGK